MLLPALIARMPSPKQNNIMNDEPQLSIYGESLKLPSKTLDLTSEDLFQMQAFKEEALEKFATSALSTPSKTSSVGQGYLSPSEITITAGSSALLKKRAAEDELSSSPIKKITIRPPRRKIVDNVQGHFRNQLLQMQMAAKIKLNEAKKYPSTGAFQHLPDVDPLRPPNCKIDPNRLWDVDTLNLGQYPRLVTTKLTYRYHQLRNPWTHAWEYVCFPIAPADDIKKSLHLGGKMKQFRWTGFWAEQKLQREIAKYEAIKEFWLFNYSVSSVVPFFAGLDKKEEFCVGLFSEELLSPWVRGWLREFLGDENMNFMESAMEGLDEGCWKKASDNILFHQDKWESLCLRFKPQENLL